jgi:hypothetical protein
VVGVPECQNCGSFVTEAYARVFTPADVDDPRCCPDCPDMVRKGATGKPRETKNGGHRKGGSEPTKYDPKKDPTVDTSGDADTANAGGSDE